MITKINVPKTSIVIEIENKEIKIENMIGYDMKMVFRNQDAEPSLDENGDVFEPLYWLDIKAKPEDDIEYHTSLGVKKEKRKLAELQIFFEYIEANKQNLFDLCGLRMKLTLKIEPKPQSRPRFARRGSFTTTYEDKGMKAWRNHCQLLIANQYMGQPILEGALRAKLRFYIKPPQYISKIKKNQQALLDEIIPVGKKPDIDNYEKALYDSMSGIVFQDDGQIALHDVGKFYSLNPRIEVEVEVMKIPEYLKK